MSKMLVVVDMQNDFIDGALGTEEAKSIVLMVKSKIDKYKNNGEEIIFTKDTHYENYLNTQEGNNLPVEHCIINTYGWNISEELNTENAEIWNKVSFGSPELAISIKERSNIEEIELIGLCTDICVISNALIFKSFMPEIKITVDASCCAGVTSQSHKTALDAMKMCQINIVNEGDN